MFFTSSGNVLRPQTLDEVVGQTETIKRLKISIDSAKQRHDVLGHILFDGAPGLGKTSLALAVAESMGVESQLANGGAIRKPKDLVPYLVKAKAGSIIFVDEIHRLSSVVEEVLYPALEDFRLDFNGNSVKLERFTFIGATTQAGEISKPLRDRFQIKEHLQLYTNDEISVLLNKNAKKLSLSITKAGIDEVAKRSRGVPRIANNHLFWVRDYAVSNQVNQIDDVDVIRAMTLLGVDTQGLDQNDRHYLTALRSVFKGQPAGLNSLESATNISRETIVGVIEPYLLSLGLIVKTPKGRIAI